jgi:GNAT superfamily N-acetyltransferase
MDATQAELTAHAAPLLRALTPADLPAALALSRAQHWSHQMQDWALHLRLGRGLGACDADGSLLGTTIWWDWDGRLATIGLVVVRPDCQGRGIGRRLMQAILAETEPRPVGLVATDAGLRLYRECGFAASGGILQCQGVVRGSRVVPPEGLSLRPVTVGDRPSLLALDSAALGASRVPLVEAVLETARPALLAERNGCPVGFALQRPAGGGVTIGPLVAADEEVAIALADAALEHVEGVARLDVSADATGLVDRLGSRGLGVVDRVTAMMRGTAPPVRGSVRRFGLVSQAFG